MPQYQQACDTPGSMTFVSKTPPSTEDSPEARNYSRVRRWLGFADFAIGLIFLVVLLATGWSAQLRDLADRMGWQIYSISVFLYLFFLLALAKALGFGFDYYAFALERRYKLSTQRIRTWLWDEAKEFLVGLLLCTIIVELLYFTLREFPLHWWLLARIMSMVLFIALAQLAPIVLFPIFYKFEPLEDEDLRRRLTMLSERAGTRVRGVYRWKLSEKSTKANAALTGLGATRRIILADTLLDNYSGDEIEAVLAHELGHHVHRHILKSILVQAAVAFAGFWAANLALHYSVDHRMFEELSDFANLPLLVLVSSGISVLLMPVLNAYSRFNERQADQYAFDSIGSVEPFISSMKRLAGQNLTEQTPSKWVEWLLHSHPAVSTRIASAEAFARNHPADP